MYSQAGENDALTGKLIKMLGSRCDRFGALMRGTMTTVLSRHGVNWKEIAYRDEGGILNPIYRTPKYKDAGEPLYFESQISLCYSRIGDAVVPGAGTFNRLVTPEGDVLWGSAISIGPSFFPQSAILAMPAARHKDIYEVIEGSPDQAAATLMALAAPLGSATGELLLSATDSK